MLSAFSNYFLGTVFDIAHRRSYGMVCASSACSRASTLSSSCEPKNFVAAVAIPGALAVIVPVRRKPLVRRTRVLCKLNGAKGEVLKLTAVGTETEEVVDERVGWQSIVEHDVRKDAQWGSDQEQGGRGRARGTVRRFRVVGEAFHSAVVTNRGGERSWI